MGHISRRRISAKRTGTIIVGPGSAARKLADAPGKARSEHLSTSPLHHPARNAPQSCASRGNGFSLDKRILQDTAIPRNPSHLPYKEEVAGSNPASPTSRIPAKWQNFVGKGTESGSISRLLYCNPDGSVSRYCSEGCFHRVDCRVLHIGEYMGVGVEGD